MPTIEPDHKADREFALSVVQKLRGADFQALWAGGCVRDSLMGLEPRDYDVATTATPAEVIELFGKRRTVPVGVSFGVVIVTDQTRQGSPVEVATFRADGEYQDGRRPASVEFCSAEEDARRRDFTINGMFFDPVDEKVLDYVGGRRDLEARLVTAIGDPHARFTEDKLRMLRAVRFAATLDFRLDTRTEAAIRRQKDSISQVSSERIAEELRRMLAHESRSTSIEMLHDTGLLEVVFRDLFSALTDVEQYVTETRALLRALQCQHFEPALAALLRASWNTQASHLREQAADVREQCRMLKLSNEESDAVCWILEGANICIDPQSLELHVIKPLMADKRHALLIDYLRAIATAQGLAADGAEFLQTFVASTSPAELNPEPLVDGRDLKNLGIKPGPEFKRLLTVIRNEQLDEAIQSRGDALDRLRELNDESDGGVE